MVNTQGCSTQVVQLDKEVSSQESCLMPWWIKLIIKLERKKEYGIKILIFPEDDVEEGWKQNCQ
jgi:hypothetical protein